MGRESEVADAAASDLLVEARAARDRLDLDEHERLVDSLEQEHGDVDGVRVAVAAERLRDVAYFAEPDDGYRGAAERITGLLDRGGHGPAVRARLLVGRAGCHARLREPGWGATAADDYVAATREFIAAGERDSAAATAAAQAWTVDLVLHGLRQAASRLAEAIELAASPDKSASFLTQHAKVNLWLGDVDEARRDVARARRLSHQGVLSPTTGAYLCWAEVLVHATTGEVALLQAALERADGLVGDWHGTVTGVQFEAEVADALALVGEEDAAFARLERARARIDEEPDAVHAADVAVHARVGEPQRAIAAWDRVRESGLQEPWDLARLALLAALAQHRLGEDAGPLAAEAFEQAALHALPAMLERREPEAVAALLSAAVDAGSDAAAAVRRSRFGHRLELLGPPALVTPDGERIPMTGRAVTLLAVLASASRSRSAESVARQVWHEDPDETELVARLRRLLHRVRSIAPVVERTDDGRVRLATDTVTDVTELDVAVAAAREAGEGPSLLVHLDTARRLAGHATPERLQLRDDLPEELRGRLLRQLHWVHRRVAEVESDRGRDDRARAELRLALAYRPDDDVCAAQLARSLLAEGRRADAADTLRQTAAVLRGARVKPSRTFADLAAQLLA